MNKGVTLIELIVVIVLLGVMGTVWMSVLNEGVKAYVMSTEEGEAQDSAGFALRRMVREIRELNNASISAATAIQFSFTNPYNTALTGGANTVTFRRPGTTLERSGDGGVSWQILAENVTNSDIFTYYKKVPGSDAVAFDPATPPDTYADIQWVLVKIKVSEGEETASRREQVFVLRDPE